ncbi:MAG TPA: hypothetical protein VK674_02830 [Candidatus Limnocylindria bacterium]|nr:hypothetical protein [Candidatus Limnocylindria bacterium]
MEKPNLLIDKLIAEVRVRVMGRLAAWDGIVSEYRLPPPSCPDEISAPDLPIDQTS